MEAYEAMNGAQGATNDAGLTATLQGFTVSLLANVVEAGRI